MNLINIEKLGNFLMSESEYNYEISDIGRNGAVSSRKRFNPSTIAGKHFTERPPDF